MWLMIAISYLTRTNRNQILRAICDLTKNDPCGYTFLENAVKIYKHINQLSMSHGFAPAFKVLNGSNILISVRQFLKEGRS